MQGTKLLSLLGPNIWELVPEDIEQSESLDVFKSKTKNWVPLRCPCRLFRLYLQDRFHLTMMSFFKMIYLWMKAIEYIFNHFIQTYYYPMIVITACLEIPFGVILCYTEVFPNRH